ncbi:MAG: class I SAM-dependent methyltransferase [Patescibacteria group bacterium]
MEIEKRTIPLSDSRDSLDSSRRFVAGITTKSRLELDFFNLYGWLLQYVEGKKVLDAACGSGLGSFLLAHKAQEVFGIDISEEAVKYASERYRLSNLKFIRDDILTYKLPADHFDVAVSAMTIEQLEAGDHPKFLSILAGSLRPGGLLFIVTPNKQVASPGIKSPSFHWNKKELYRKELEYILIKSGFTPVKWFGRRRVPFFMANRVFKRTFNLIQKISGWNHGFYSTRESPAVKPINFFWQPKDFVAVARKSG